MIKGQKVAWSFNYAVKSELSKEELTQAILTRLNRGLEVPLGKLEVNKAYYTGGFDSITVTLKMKFRGFNDAMYMADHIEQLVALLNVNDMLSLECHNQEDGKELDRLRSEA